MLKYSGASLRLNSEPKYAPRAAHTLCFLAGMGRPTAFRFTIARLRSMSSLRSMGSLRGMSSKRLGEIAQCFAWLHSSPVTC